MTYRLTWGENYLQSLFKVAPENLVARKTAISLHERARAWKLDNSREFFNKLATKKSRWHLLPVVQEGPLEK